MRAWPLRALPRLDYKNHGDVFSPASAASLCWENFADCRPAFVLISIWPQQINYSRFGYYFRQNSCRTYSQLGIAVFSNIFQAAAAAATRASRHPASAAPTLRAGARARCRDGVLPPPLLQPRCTRHPRRVQRRARFGVYCSCHTLHSGRRPTQRRCRIHRVVCQHAAGILVCSESLLLVLMSQACSSADYGPSRWLPA